AGPECLSIGEPKESGVAERRRECGRPGHCTQWPRRESQGDGGHLPSLESCGRSSSGVGAHLMDVPTGINPTAVYPLARFDRDLGSIESRIQASETAKGQTRLDELRSVTQQFEALFLSYLMKVMRSTVEVTDSDASSMGKDIYTEMFDSELASNISRT